MRSVSKVRTTWGCICWLATGMVFCSTESEAALEWPGNGGESASSPVAMPQDQPPAYPAQGVAPRANPQPDAGKWEQRRGSNNPRWNRNQTGPGVSPGAWRPQETGGQPPQQPYSGGGQPPTWSAPGQIQHQDFRPAADSFGAFSTPAPGSGPFSSVGNGDWSPLTDTGLLGIGVVGNGADGLRRYLDDLRKWLAIKDAQTEAWEGFAKAATGFVASRVNPLTNIPDIHLNSVDWAKKRSEALKEWMQQREAVVAAYEKLHATLDADQKEHADRLSGFFRQGGGG
ncbi:MAG: hypothetical protein HQL64_11020 [Magnetococcales bacterium]|nr:hypothetical protein [Magnetococcales bacterium]